MKVLLVVLSVVLAVCAAPSPAQQVYQSESKSWKFTVPDEWNMIGFEVMKGIEAKMREQHPDRPTTYLLGVTKGGMNTLAYPRVLVAIAKVDMSGVTLEDLDAGLQRGRPTSDLDEARKLFARDAGLVSGGTIDKVRMRSVANVSKTNEEGQEVNVTVYTYLGQQQTVRFECSDLVSNGDRAAASFDNLVNTFSFRDDKKFVPAVSSTGGPFDGIDDTPWKKQDSQSSSSGGWRYRRFGLGGIVVLVVLGILKLIFRD